MAIESAAFGDPKQSADTFQEYLEALRKSEGRRQKIVFIHMVKEVLAEKDRREHGLPVNDNTMVELC